MWGPIWSSAWAGLGWVENKAKKFFERPSTGQQRNYSLSVKMLMTYWLDKGFSLGICTLAHYRAQPPPSRAENLCFTLCASIGRCAQRRVQHQPFVGVQLCWWDISPDADLPGAVELLGLGSAHWILSLFWKDINVSLRDGLGLATCWPACHVSQ